MPSLKKRSYEAELMDDLEGGGADMARTLDELEIINKRLGGHTVVLDGLKRILNKKPVIDNTVLSIADLGCGGGDMLRIVARWARKRGIKVQLTGVDANEFIVRYAADKSVDYPEISYICKDIFSEEFSLTHYDIVMCSLFCHHFEDGQLARLFSQLHKQARKGVLINDLHRHWFAYYSIKYITRVFSGSPLIRNDAPLSVARAFSRKDMQHILKDAGIRHYTLRWMWAWRWQVIF
jgi:SAM-dependent methyltransferase